MSIFSYYSSFLAGILFVATSIVTSEIPTGVYDAANALKERENRLNRMCSKYDDELKYEYKALYSVPQDLIYQTHVADPKDYDHIYKYMTCSNGAWDKVYMRRLIRQSFYLNLDKNNTKSWRSQLSIINDLPKDDGREHLKDYKRIILVENPFLKFVDYYQHYYVNAPRSGEQHTDNIVKFFLNEKIDRLSKDIDDHKEGQKYFEVSYLKEGVITFRQFINFIVSATSETMQGKKIVSDFGGFTTRWEPMWKHCTPCIKDLRYQYVVDLDHVDEDLDYILHNELNIHNETDGTPFKIQPYFDPEGFKLWKKNYENWVFDGFAKNNPDAVEKFYATLTKSEIRGLYEKYRLDFELFGFNPDKYLEFGMDDETTPSYDP